MFAILCFEALDSCLSKHVVVPSDDYCIVWAPFYSVPACFSTRIPVAKLLALKTAPFSDEFH